MSVGEISPKLAGRAAINAYSVSQVPNAYQRKLLQSIRAGIAASSGAQNAAQRPPLLAPPAWVATTAYLQGQVVTNSGAGAGFLYICAVAGTSAGSGGPTGDGAPLITDGGVTWQYFGPVLTSTNQALAPAVSYAGGAANTNTSFNLSAGYTTGAAGPITSQYFYFDGGYWQDSGSTFNNYAELGGSSPGSTTVGGITSLYWANPGGSVTFYTDAATIIINNGMHFPTAHLIEVDDVSLSDTYFFPTTYDGLVIDFSSVGGIRPRKIRTYTNALQNVACWTNDTISQVWAAQPPNAYKIAVTGDSTTGGSAGGPYTNRDSWPYRFARMIGCENITPNGVGGTGFVATGTYGFNFLASAQMYPLINPDVLLIAGNLNDGSTGAAAEQAAVIQFLQYFRSICPNALVVAFGPWGGVYNGNSTILNCEANLAAGIAAMNDPFMFFIPLIARPSGFPWITGTGRISAQVAGNSSKYVYTDGVHPTALAHKDYMPRVYAEAFKNLISSLPY